MENSAQAGKFQHLVVDTSAFIRNVQLQNIAENCYTVRGVVREIKHDKQLKALAVLPYELKVLQPNPDALTKVVAFAKKTGDYASLSLVDLEVIALTYELEVLHVGEEHLKTEPKTAVTVVGAQKPLALQGTELTKGFYEPKTSEGETNEQVAEQGNEGTGTSELALEDSSDGSLHDDKESEEQSAGDNEEDYNDDEYDEDDEEGEDDDEGWITPSNIAQVKRDYGMNCMEEVPSPVACITTDFAIQNVLKQIGLKVAALDGRVITQSRTFILRCYACFKTTPDATKVFCPRCGNQTLKKVAVSLDENGQQIIHINNRRPLTAKYKNRPVAGFTGGKYSTNPLLFEDQPLPQQRISAKARSKTNALAEDYTAGSSPFVVRDVDSRSAVLRGATNLKQRMKNFDYDNKRRGYKK